VAPITPGRVYRIPWGYRRNHGKGPAPRPVAPRWPPRSLP